MSLFRFRVSRSVIILGIWLMPSSRAKRELLQLLDVWTTNVRNKIADQEDLDAAARAFWTEAEKAHLAKHAERNPKT